MKKLLALLLLTSSLTSCVIYRTPTGENVGKCRYKVVKHYRTPRQSHGPSFHF